MLIKITTNQSSTSFLAGFFKTLGNIVASKDLQRTILINENYISYVEPSDNNRYKSRLAVIYPHKKECIYIDVLESVDEIHAQSISAVQ
jgi:hypothetical protein